MREEPFLLNINPPLGTRCFSESAVGDVGPVYSIIAIDSDGDIFDLSERLDEVAETGDGSFEEWYG